MSDQHIEDLVGQVMNGFEGVEAKQKYKKQAVEYLRRWLTDETLSDYVPQIRWLIETEQWKGLLDRFYQILPFGTGGRRGAVGIGPNRMNRWTLETSVQGHCEFLKERFPGVNPIRVALAYDVRQFEDQREQYNPDLPNPALHVSSRDLAEYAARVYAANGIHSHILPAESKRFLATPELSFAIRELGAHGGLNVSASHNPPDDNGGKFYDDRGAQPVPPEDQIMADIVDQVKGIKSLAWQEAVRSGLVHLFDNSLHDDYIEVCCQQSLVAPPKTEDFKVVFTPLHGVGAMTAMEVLEKRGFRVLPVASQMTPDGQFPNVTGNPNPENPDSMDRAIALAEERGADLVLSTDPDADRLGAMIPDRDGGWRFVTGNEICALLTYFKLSKLVEQSRMPASPLVVTTCVTTGQITRIARHFKTQVVDYLLVGFKYPADLLRQIDESGSFDDVTGTLDDFVLATEESHGALLSPRIRDKDAGAAALLLAELALEQHRQGKTMLDYLDAMNREFGYFTHELISIYLRGVEGKEQIAQIMDGLRESPLKTIAGIPVTQVEDLLDEDGRFGPHKGATDAASRNVLIFRCEENVRIAIRPSGTEPKAKIYVEASSAPRGDKMSEQAWNEQCATVDALATKLAADFVEQALDVIGLDPSAAG